MRIFATIVFSCLAMFGQVTLPGVKPEEKKEKPVDTLGRTSPRSSITGFLRAAEADRYPTAARFLEVPERIRLTAGVTLARELQAVMNEGFTNPLGLLSEKPEGNDEEGLAPNKENLGKIVIGDESVDLILVRVPEGASGEVWLVSQETLARVPALYKNVTTFSLLEKIPPQFQRKFLGLELWQWIGVVVLFALAYGVALFVALVVKIALRRTNFKLTALPQGAVILLTFFLHTRLIGWLEMPVLYRSYYRRFVGILLLIGLTWLLMRVIDRIAEIARLRAVSAGKLATGSWVILGRRLVKALVGIAAALIFLGGLGFDMSTAIAGVGIGGIAIGFGAQKTIENLFGGLSVASDEVIRIGDVCNFGGRTGTVTDIGLRSTRVRTPERTELSIPNGVLATMNVENLSLRDKLLFQTTLGLQYETNANQLRHVMESIRQLFTEDFRVEPGFRVRFVNYGENSLNVEIFVYILTPDWNIFCEIREDLLLKIMDIVEAEGSGFAFPSRTVYIKQDKSAESELLRPEFPLPADTNAP